MATPPDALEDYFRARGYQTLASLDWMQSPRCLVDDMLRRIELLPPAASASIWADFDRAAQFADDAGRTALRSVLTDQPACLSRFDELVGSHACALYVMVTNPEAFERSLAIHYATRLRNGRDWSPLEVTARPGAALRQDAESLPAFECALKGVLASHSKSAGGLKVDRFVRETTDPDTGCVSRLVQFTVYVEGAPATALEFEGAADVVRRTIRPATEAALVYDEKAMSLDVFGKGGKAIRQDIAQAFTETLMDGAEINTRPRRRLRLEAFKSRPALATHPQDDVLRASVESVKLRAPGAAGGLLTIDRKATETDDLYADMDQWFGDREPLRSPGWTVLEAKLRIVFKPAPGKKSEQRVLVELKYPDRTNLRDQTERHRTIADTLLDRWGLYAA